MTRPESDAFDSLNPRQQVFVESYVASGNASDAYRQAGYSASGSAQTVSSNAVQLLENQRIAAAVSQRTRERLEKFGFEADRVVLELACIGFADIRDVLTVEADGTVRIKPSAEWSDNAAAAVASVTMTEFKGKVTTSLKQHNKVDALEKLAKRLNLYREHQEATGTGLAAAAYAALLEYDRTKQQQQQQQQQQQGDNSQEQQAGEQQSPAQQSEQDQADGQGQHSQAQSQAEPAQGPSGPGQEQQQTQEPGDSRAGADAQQREALSRAVDQALAKGDKDAAQAEQPATAVQDEATREQRQALEQWLERVPDDPGGLLRRKFMLEYQRRQQGKGDAP